MTQYSTEPWKKYISNIDEVMKKLHDASLLSVGITAYTRITPALFLDNYSIYAVKNSSDTDVMKEKLSNMYTLEDVDKKLADKVNGTGFLVGSHRFEKFIKSRKRKPTLIFDITTDKLIEVAKRLNVSIVGNKPETYEDVYLKGDFRSLMKESDIETVPNEIIEREAFVAISYEQLQAAYKDSVVVQRADKETGVSGKTFFIHSEKDLQRCQQIFTEDKDFNKVLISSFIQGYSVSMLGCATQKGTLTAPLQLQLIDVPEALHGVAADGVFFGNDLLFKDWSDEIETTAQSIVEVVGEHLYKKGYKGIFGIDFMYDKVKGKLYPTECNPRGTGSLLLHSLAALENDIPPIDFFHLAEHLQIQVDFDFNETNVALKKRAEFSNIAISPKGIEKMPMDLLAGVYNYSEESKALTYKGSAISLDAIKDKDDFIIIDTVPYKYTVIGQQFPRLFKFIFPYSISKSSQEIESRASFLIKKFSRALLSASNK